MTIRKSQRQSINQNVNYSDKDDHEKIPTPKKLVLTLAKPKPAPVEVIATEKAKNSIEEYLESLSDATCDRLYNQPSSCLAVLKLLPHNAKIIVMRLLYVKGKVQLSIVYNWFRSSHIQQRNFVIRKLRQLKLLKFSSDGMKLWLSPAFSESLHQALCGTGTSDSFGCAMPEVTVDSKVTLQLLDMYAAQQWEAVLYYLAGSQGTAKPDRAAQTVLVAAGLVRQSASDSSWSITNEGFQFLLLDTSVQIWRLLLQYLAIAEAKSLDSVAYLELFFILGTLELGQAYSIKPFNKLQKQIISDLQSLGLVYKSPSYPDCFFATRFSTLLTSGISSSFLSSHEAQRNASAAQVANEEENSGFIILETNYRVYAYTDSLLQISILDLFVEIRARLCNVVVGMITRDSIRTAVEKGITANQIIRYLTKNAHPEMRKNQHSIVPMTVMDQIWLWELERNRLQLDPGLLYFDFPDDSIFEKFKAYADSVNVVLYVNDKDRRIVCSTFAKDQLRQKLKQFKDEI